MSINQEKTVIEREIEGRYTPKKSLNRKAYSYIKKYLGEKAGTYFEECSTFISFLTDEGMSVKKQYKGNSCKNRFCPICNWKKAQKDAMKLSVMMEAIKQRENKDFLFLTLTAPNCGPDELVDTINQFNKAYHKLFKRRNVQKSIKGYSRKLEVTTDQDFYITKESYRRKKEYFDRKGLKVGDENPQYNTYNPHFHAILVVDKSYFKKKDLYITQDEWLSMWKECMEDQSITQVRIERVKKKGDSNAVLEIAKYAAKNNDLLYSEQVFDVFYKALKGRQLLVYSGIMKEYALLYESGELDEYKEVDENTYTHLLMANWINSKYEKQLRALNEEELKSLHKKNYIDEIDEID